MTMNAELNSHRTLRMSRASGESRRNVSGFTLIELLVVLAIISVLASMLMPALSVAKEKARSISCVNNLKQMALATHLYADDNNGYLVPAEYNVKNGAKFEEGWPTILVNTGYLPAPRATNYNGLAAGGSVFRCPSGLPKVYDFNPSARDDAEGAKAFAYTSASTGRRFFVHSWYGINGGLGVADRWPFTRVPLDSGKVHLNKMDLVASVSSRMPAYFDGFWIHNGKDERIHARHTKGRRTNVAMFDGSVVSHDTFRIPSVSAKPESSSLQWQLPDSR